MSVSETTTTDPVLYNPHPQPATWEDPRMGQGIPTSNRNYGRCSPSDQLHRWTCKHESRCECGEVIRVAVPEGL